MFTILCFNYPISPQYDICQYLIHEKEIVDLEDANLNL